MMKPWSSLAGASPACVVYNPSIPPGQPSKPAPRSSATLTIQLLSEASDSLRLSLATIALFGVNATLKQ
jgi:hypothetical protein